MNSLTAARKSMFIDLVEGGCPHRIAEVIANGTTFPNPDLPYSNYSIGRHDPGSIPNIAPIRRPRFTYLAGPMRGYPDFNFPAFDEARDSLVRRGFAVISPADIDRAAGDYTDTEGFVAAKPNSPTTVKPFVFRDFHAIYFMDAEQGDCVSLLPGWESSTGVYAETGLARWLMLPFICAVTAEPLKYKGFNIQELAESMWTYVRSK